MKTKRVFADLPEAVVNRFLGKAKEHGSTGKAEIEVFVNQYVSSSGVFTHTSVQGDEPARVAGQSGSDPLAGLSTEDLLLVRRLIAAIRSGAFEDTQTIDRLLRAFEATHSPHEETPVKGKKHRRSA